MSIQTIIFPKDNATDLSVLKYLDKYEKDHPRHAKSKSKDSFINNFSSKTQISYTIRARILN